MILKYPGSMIIVILHVLNTLWKSEVAYLVGLGYDIDISSVGAFVNEIQLKL